MWWSSAARPRLCREETGSSAPADGPGGRTRRCWLICESEAGTPDGISIVGFERHRRRSVLVRQDAHGEVFEPLRIENDPVALACGIENLGSGPEVVLEAPYGWY